LLANKEACQHLVYYLNYQMSSQLFSVGAVIIMAVLFFYMLMGSVIEKYHWPVGHEAGLVIILGMILSYAALESGHTDMTHMLSFNENFFFYFCLPPIVFASGYNMKRKKFFENFGNILLFGLIGTVVQFSLFSIFTYIVVQFDFLEKYNGETG
jgi:solute carrier family 9 (sodium/hydrogen exchanger), member 6/7